MARKRMFSIMVTDTDSFLEMSTSAQCLYFHLGMHADDDGFCAGARKICRDVGCADSDLKELVDNGFIFAFDSGVIVIRDWRINNTLKKDRYLETLHIEEMARLETDRVGRYRMKKDSEPELDEIGTNGTIGTKTEPAEPQYSIEKNSISPSDSVKPEQKKREKKVYDHDSNPYKCAAFLAGQMTENFPDINSIPEKDMQSWADDFRKLNEIDRYDWDLIAEVLEFATKDEFWKKNIQSGQTFRKQFRSLIMRKGSEQ